jgi:hypothetical protein
VDEKLLAVARRQHGLLTVGQVTRAGQRKLLRNRLRSGEWVEEQPQVVRPALWEPTREARLAAIRLALTPSGKPRDWCFSHTTAASLQRLKVPDRPEIHVLLPMTRRRLPLRGVVRHFTEKPVRVMHVVGEPSGMLVPTVLQCASVLQRDDLVTLVENLVRDSRLDLAFLRNACGRGISGSAALRSVVDELDGEGLDRWVRRLVPYLLAAGLPPPALEVPVYDGSRLRALLDGLFDEVGLAFEVDDWDSHGPRDASERDRQRDRWLFNTYGIVTVRVTPREIREDPGKVAAEIRRAYEQRQASRSTAQRALPAGPLRAS